MVCLPLGIENIYFTLICWNVSPPRWAIFIRYQFVKLIRWVWELSMFKNIFLRQHFGIFSFFKKLCAAIKFLCGNSQLAILSSKHTITKLFILPQYFQIFSTYLFHVISSEKHDTWSNSTCKVLQNINPFFSGEERITLPFPIPDEERKLT